MIPLPLFTGRKMPAAPKSVTAQAPHGARAAAAGCSPAQAWTATTQAIAQNSMYSGPCFCQRQLKPLIFSTA